MNISEQTKPTKSPNRRLAIVLGVVAAVLAIALVGLTAFAPLIKNMVRARAQKALEDRFESQVAVRSFDVDLFPRPKITLEGVTFQHRKYSGFPPLIEIARVEADANFGGLLIRHVRLVNLTGLKIHIPKGQPDDSLGDGKKGVAHFPVVLDEVVADTALVEIIRAAGEKPPLEFDIHRLRMKDVDLDKPSDFEAQLSNPQPQGEIATQGKFGPWQADEPSLTPVSGSYDFSHADLGTFKGIGGLLESRGKYNGALQRIEVDGNTEVPGFFLTLAKHPVPLHTTFHAIVDGTNGNTALQPVQAKLLNSAFTARGEVTKVEDVQGRRVMLDVVMDQGRLEDILRLTVKADPAPITGALRFHSKLDLPPGDEDVVQKLRLDGDFAVQAARFTALNIREKLRSLSRRGKGEPEDPSAGSSVANLRGKFKMSGGVINFSSLAFELEGASVDLAGTYNLVNENLDLRGHLFLDAKLSQTTTGAKSFFLKALDPLFHKKNGGSEVPIKIGGTRSNPSFGLNL